MFDSWSLEFLWMLELGRLELYPPARPASVLCVPPRSLRETFRPPPALSSFCIFHSAFADAITVLEKLNFSRECRMQIYAIYFQKTGVGWGSDPKNPLKFKIPS
jgi:hypothetical protein